MIKVTKEINLEQLDKEINGKGLIGVVDDNLKITAVGLGDANDATEQDLIDAVANHVAKPLVGPSIEEKLASVGLSVDDLKAALGL
jgi:hypothetical protein